jgi:ABC-2 type transport system ATP-binding protein
MWELISEQVAGGATLLLTTQYLEEADQLAHDIVVIDHGRVIARGTAQQLKARVGGARLDVKIAPGADLAQAARAVSQFANAQATVEAEERRVVAPIAETPGLITRLAAALDAEGIAIDDVQLRRPTLDDVFLQITGHAAEETAAEPVEPAKARLSAEQEAA